jgi:hypothetical protein
MILQFGATSPVFSGPGLNDQFVANLVQTSRSTGGAAQAAASYYDSMVIPTTNAGVVTEGTITASQNAANPSFTYTSLTPSIATVNAAGKLSYVANGIASILCSGTLISKVFQQAMNSNVAATYALGSFKIGSLGAHVTAQLSTLTSGKTPGSSAQQCFLSNNANPAAPAVGRNTASLAASLDFTGTSVCGYPGFNSGSYFPGHLISSRHILCAEHVKLGVGTTIAFLDSLGAYQLATVTSGALVAGSKDIWVGYLTWQAGSAPSNLHRYKMLPSNYASYISSCLSGLSKPVSTLPVLTRTVHDQAGNGQGLGWWNISALGGYNSAFKTVFSGGASLSASNPFSMWSGDIISGDSGSGVFLVINGELVITQSFYTAAGGDFYADFVSDINSTMTSLAGSAYAVATVSLAAFTQYPEL